MTTKIKIDRISWDAIDRFANNNETPAGVSLWVQHVVEAIGHDDRAEAWDAILASAPLTGDDVDYLTSLYDAMSAGETLPEHEHVDWADTDSGDEFLVACQQILWVRASEILESPCIAYCRHTDRLTLT